jgi:hypothetical protein
MSLDQARDLHQQFFISEGEIEIVVSASVQTFNTGIVCQDPAADQEHGNVGRARVVFQTAAQLKAAENGHHDIAYYHIRNEANGQIDSFRTVGGGRDFVAFNFKEFDEQIDDLPVVIDDQDAAPV